MSASTSRSRGVRASRLPPAFVVAPLWGVELPALSQGGPQAHERLAHQRQVTPTRRRRTDTQVSEGVLRPFDRPHTQRHPGPVALAEVAEHRFVARRSKAG